MNKCSRNAIDKHEQMFYTVYCKEKEKHKKRKSYHGVGAP